MGTMYYFRKIFHIPLTYYALRVERIACGVSHNDRIIAQIILIDQYERLSYQAFVKPSRPVFSYLEKATGLSKEIVETLGINIHEAIKGLKNVIQPSATLIGQNIRQDVLCLELRQGIDFLGMMDLLGLYRLWNPNYSRFTGWCQDRLATVLLGWPIDENYNAASDALKSMRLFQLYFQLQNEWYKAFKLLVNSDLPPSFCKLYPSYEG